MVALIWCDYFAADRLDRRTPDPPIFSKRGPDLGTGAGLSEAWRRGVWEGSAPHLALLVEQDSEEIRWLGRARGGRVITDRDRIVKVTEIQRTDPLPISELEAALPRRHRQVISRKGILPPGEGDAVIVALKQLRPENVDLINHLQRPLGFRLPAGPRGELLNQERDGIGLLLDIADIGRQPFLHSWSPTRVDVPFLAGIPDRTELEDHLIAHDIERFSSWFPVATNQLAGRAFSNGNRRMFIMNANRTPVEHTLGVDVVYWNEHEGSFVLVQYKKMHREDGQDSEDANYLAYRPDHNLGSELERMRRVDAICLRGVGDFRLSAASCQGPGKVI